MSSALICFGFSPCRKYIILTSSALYRIFGLLFSSLIGSTILSGIIITPALLVHFYWYKPNPTDHRRYVRDNIDAWLFWAASNVSVSWFLAMIVDIVPTLIRYAIIVAWGHVSESIKNKLEMYNSVKDTIKPVFYAAASWVSWVILFEQIFKLYNADDESASRASYTPRVRSFLFLSSLLSDVSGRCTKRSSFCSFCHWSGAHNGCCHTRSVRHFLSVEEVYRPYILLKPSHSIELRSGNVSRFSKRL